ncbi:hypothetical protein QQF64_034165 [Cirrhinus molitorella]|uniref:Uncharacterized protein n=1 Tax=Cirrhinus molitorella TaxID=172907 RepID=A0ABR3MVZ1_9TELE
MYSPFAVFKPGPMLAKRDPKEEQRTRPTPASNGYKAQSRPPFGKSDHAAIFLMPVYKQRLKQEVPVQREVARWTDQSVAALPDALDDADWDMFRRSSDDVNVFAEAVVGSIGKLADDTIPLRCIQHGLATGNMDEYKAASYSVRRAVKEAKRRYRKKLESQFQQSDSRSLWQRLRTITDYQRPSSRMGNADASLADELNTFYARFEAAAYHASGASGTNSMHAERAGEANTFTISEHDTYAAIGQQGGTWARIHFADTTKPLTLMLAWTFSETAGKCAKLAISSVRTPRGRSRAAGGVQVPRTACGARSQPVFGPKSSSVTTDSLRSPLTACFGPKSSSVTTDSLRPCQISYSCHFLRRSVGRGGRFVVKQVASGLDRLFVVKQVVSGLDRLFVVTEEDFGPKQVAVRGTEEDLGPKQVASGPDRPFADVPPLACRTGPCAASSNRLARATFSSRAPILTWYPKARKGSKG